MMCVRGAKHELQAPGLWVTKSEWGGSDWEWRNPAKISKNFPQ